MTKPHFVVDAGVYPVDVAVFKTSKRYYKWLSQFGVKDSVDGCEARVIYLEDADGNSAFGCFLSKGASATTLSHECIHLAMYILDYVGVKVDAENHEALCYLHDHLLSQMLEAVKKG